VARALLRAAFTIVLTRFGPSLSRAILLKNTAAIHGLRTTLNQSLPVGHAGVRVMGAGAACHLPDDCARLKAEFADGVGLH